MEATHSSQVGMAEAEAEASRQERAMRNCILDCRDSRVVKQSPLALLYALFISFFTSHRSTLVNIFTIQYRPALAVSFNQELS